MGTPERKEMRNYSYIQCCYQKMRPENSFKDQAAEVRAARTRGFFLTSTRTTRYLYIPNPILPSDSDYEE